MQRHTPTRYWLSFCIFEEDLGLSMTIQFGRFSVSYDIKKNENLVEKMKSKMFKRTDTNVSIARFRD